MKEDVASTGIAGLDHVLRGGFPRGHVYLIQGDPGVGKTTLGLQFLLAGARNGETGLFITLSETKRELEAVAESHGWSLDSIHIYEQLVGDNNMVDDETSVFYPAEIQLGETIKGLLDEVERLRPTRVVVDSLSEIRLLAQNQLRYRKQILALKQFFVNRNATVLFLDDRTDLGQDMQLQSVPHGVIELERYTPLYGAARRRLEVVKIRGLDFRDGYHDFSIRTGGIVVYPRLVAAESRSPSIGLTLSSGLENLDAMLAGGIQKGTSTLIMGPAGSGKSSLATQYAIAAAKRGEKAGIFIFEESLGTLRNRVGLLGEDLGELEQKGLVHLHQVDPAQLQPGEFATVVRQSVELDEVSVLIIDSVNGYLNAVPEERFLLLHLHELLTYLGQRGVATILVFAQHGLIGNMQASVDLSYLADSVILLRYFEAQGRIHKAISIMKKRSGPHETAIRELIMDGDGLQVGDVLGHFHGILTGVPYFTLRSVDEPVPEISRMKR